MKIIYVKRFRQFYKVTQINDLCAYRSHYNIAINSLVYNFNNFRLDDALLINNLFFHISCL